MRHMLRGEEGKSGGTGALKNKARENTESTYCALARAAHCSQFVNSIVEHFELHLDLICIRIHYHVDWPMADINFGEYSNPVWEYQVFVEE